MLKWANQGNPQGLSRKASITCSDEVLSVTPTGLHLEIGSPYLVFSLQASKSHIGNRLPKCVAMGVLPLNHFVLPHDRSDPPIVSMQVEAPVVASCGLCSTEVCAASTARHLRIAGYYSIESLIAAFSLSRHLVCGTSCLSLHPHRWTRYACRPLLICHVMPGTPLSINISGRGV